MDRWVVMTLKFVAFFGSPLRGSLVTSLTSPAPLGGGGAGQPSGSVRTAWKSIWSGQASGDTQFCDFLWLLSGRGSGWPDSFLPPGGKVDFVSETGVSGSSKKKVVEVFVFGRRQVRDQASWSERGCKPG